MQGFILHLQQARKKQPDILTVRQTMRIRTHLRTEGKITVIGDDFCCLSTFKYTPVYEI